MRPANPHHRAPRLLLAVVAAGLCPAGHAARPLATDDPGVLDRGQCEAEAVLGRDRAPGTETLKSRSLQLGCGIGGASQVALGASHDRAGEERASGLALAGKTALNAPEAAWPLALGWGLAWQRSAGTGWRHAETSLLLLASSAWGPGTQVVMNLGHVRDAAARQGSTAWGLGVDHAVSEDLGATAEVQGDDRKPPWWNLGLRWNLVPERCSLDIAYGRQITGGRPQRLSLGANFSF